MRPTIYFLFVVFTLILSWFVITDKNTEGSIKSFKENDTEIQDVDMSDRWSRSPATGIPHVVAVWGVFSLGSF